VVLLSDRERTVVGGYGVSGLWGEKDGNWFPLLNESHPMFESNKPPVKGGQCLVFTTEPDRVLIRPRPEMADLFSMESIQQRIFEVSR
jgi:hypothetical protein